MTRRREGSGTGERQEDKLRQRALRASGGFFAYLYLLHNIELLAIRWTRASAICRR
jgi:hypothetical protein